MIENGYKSFCYGSAFSKCSICHVYRGEIFKIKPTVGRRLQEFN